MDPSQFYPQFRDKLLAEYPSTQVLADDFDLEHLISPYVLRIDHKILTEAENFVLSLFQLSRRDDYRQAIETPFDEILAHPPRHQSVLMAYDFHPTPQRNALIEINTNAAMFLVSDLLNRCQDISLPLTSLPLNTLKDSFLEEFRQFRQDPLAVPQKIVITDENIKSQKRYIEFLMFKDLFNSWGWNPEIIDFTDLHLDPSSSALFTPSGEKIDLLYNRYCDFYLERPESQHLREAYLKGICCITPNPFEYLLLADKRRMQEWSSTNFRAKIIPAGNENLWENIEVLLSQTSVAHAFDSEELWRQKKKFFFKPQNQYGGKSVYRGEGLTRAVFDRVLKENFLVQEFIPAPEPIFSDPSIDTRGWKYDLRFYAYQGKIQNVVARIYKGQVTNFAQAMGGFASVQFI